MYDKIKYKDVYVNLRKVINDLGYKLLIIYVFCVYVGCLYFGL